jgi:hypothetical protein
MIGAATLAACHLLVGVEDEVGESRATADASGGDVTQPPTDASPADAGPPDPCEHAAPPPRPDASDFDAGGSPPAFALDRLVAMTDEGKSGFDLDGQCTCDPRPGAKAGPGCRSKKAEDISCDGDGGRDEGSKKLINGFIGPDLPPIDLFYGDKFDAGVSAVLIEVADFNGTPNDPSVKVSFYDGAGRCPDAAGEPCWNLQALSAVDRIAKALTKRAWVNNGVLVADFGDKTIRLRVGPVYLEVESAIVTANMDLSAGGGGSRLRDGVIAGRVLGSNLIHVFANQLIYDGMDGGAPVFRLLCSAGSRMEDFRKVLCPLRDMASIRDAEAPCDSMAITLGFSASPAQIGAITSSGGEAPACDAASIPACP